MYVLKFGTKVLIRYLVGSGHKKKRAREKETPSRARPFSLSPTTSKRLLRRLVLSRKRFLKSFSSSFSFSNLLLVFSVTPFKIDQKKNQNRSIDNNNNNNNNRDLKQRRF